MPFGIYMVAVTALLDASGSGVGGDEEDRTPDLRIANATLSQLSYAPNSLRV
jgi:hypothetical protein